VNDNSFFARCCATAFLRSLKPADKCHPQNLFLTVTNWFKAQPGKKMQIPSFMTAYLFSQVQINHRRNTSPDTQGLSRRRFLKVSAGLAAGIIGSAPFASAASSPRYHSFSFFHTHTGETLKLNFDVKQRRVEKTEEFFHFLRDFRTGDIHPIDTRLLDILYRLQVKTNRSGTFEVLSGYRSPDTNTRLQKANSGVAKKSLHMKGRAIDIRLSGVPTKTLKDIACSMKQGGVGFYAKSDFIHVDTGRVRTW
jgi:uncharacterized protein YcbK (DUF882 family)